MVRSRPVIIAVDGPAGSGKSSVCARLAEILGWTYVNTGAIYRAASYIAGLKNVDVKDEAALAQLIGHVVRELVWDGLERKLFYAGTDITSHLSDVDVGARASAIARLPAVRSRLLDLQRHLALQAGEGAIVDGRDIGTVVFPDADLKIFLTASLEERARRRAAQLGVMDGQAQQTLREEIARRDASDAGREAAPMKLADDAISVDTTGLNLDDVVLSIRQKISALGLWHDRKSAKI